MMRDYFCRPSATHRGANIIEWDDIGLPSINLAVVEELREDEDFMIEVYGEVVLREAMLRE